MKITGKTDLSAILSSKALNPAPDSDLLQKVTPRRKIRNSSYGAEVRLKRGGAPVGKKSRPETPLLRWKFDERQKNVCFKDEKLPPEVGRKSGRKVRRGKEIVLPVRKLAAELWRLQLPEFAASGNERHCLPNSEQLGFQLEPSFQFSNSAMEGATKWDPVCTKTLDEVEWIYGCPKLLNQQVSATMMISSLKVELEQARACIHDLETERQSSKKEFEQFLKKLSEEKATWQSREHEKIRAFIDDIKADMNRERKNCRRLENFNSKLLNELADAKLAAKRFMKDYEKERKARELIEEVCDELAKEVGEDKAEVESMMRESMRLQEEVEEERKMLQMAEVWREERVQMKLIDAKVTLEEKYCQMNKLVADLESFLSSKRATPDSEETRTAEFLRQAAAWVKIQDIKEFNYDPPNPNDILSIFEDVNFGQLNKREIEPCVVYSPPSHSSKIHTMSPEVNACNKDRIQRHSNAYLDQNGFGGEDGSGWETVSHPEDQGSSYSPGGSDPSVNKICQPSNVSGSGTEWEENAGEERPITEISEVCSVPTTKWKKKSSISRLWSSCPSNGENYKIISLFNGAIISPDRVSGKGELGPTDLAGQWSSPDSGIPRITRGTKVCIELQRGSLKAKLLEARTESQKIQLRQVLKQKI